MNWERYEQDKAESQLLDQVTGLVYLLAKREQEHADSLFQFGVDTREKKRGLITPIVLAAHDVSAANPPILSLPLQGVPPSLLEKFNIPQELMRDVIRKLKQAKIVEIQSWDEFDVVNLAPGPFLRPSNALEPHGPMQATHETFQEYTNAEKGDENEFDHSEPLDVHKWSNYPQVNSFVDQIYRTNFRSRKTEIAKKHLKVILLDLYVRWRKDPTLKTAIHRDPNQYKAKSRYNTLHISKLTIDVVNILLELGLLGQKIGFRDRIAGRGRISRIWPTGQLIELFQKAEFEITDIESHFNQECIILRNTREIEHRDSKNDTIVVEQEDFNVEYSDTAETVRMRDELKAYNRILEKTFIDIPQLEVPIIRQTPNGPKLPSPIYISQTDKFVRRIFNRGRWDKGGRFYGGWWQRCPKEWRKKIFMNDEPTNEIDYSGLHIVLLYAKRGVDYWKTVRRDPYRVTRPDFLPDDETTREVTKSLLLMAVNADSELSTFQAFRAAAEPGSIQKNLKNEQLRHILNELRSLHRTIEQDLSSDAGIDLMNTDARIAEKIMKVFVQNEKPLLTIHDSFIVLQGDENLLDKTMRSAFEQVTGVKGVQLKELQPKFDTLLSNYEQSKWMTGGGKGYSQLTRERLVEPHMVFKSSGYLSRLKNHIKNMQAKEK